MGVVSFYIKTVMTLQLRTIATNDGMIAHNLPVFECHDCAHYLCEYSITFVHYSKFYNHLWMNSINYNMHLYTTRMISR